MISNYVKKQKQKQKQGYLEITWKIQGFITIFGLVLLWFNLLPSSTKSFSKYSTFFNILIGCYRYLFFYLLNTIGMSSFLYQFVSFVKLFICGVCFMGYAFVNFEFSFRLYKPITCLIFCMFSVSFSCRPMFGC